MRRNNTTIAAAWLCVLPTIACADVKTVTKSMVVGQSQRTAKTDTIIAPISWQLDAGVTDPPCADEVKEMVLDRVPIRASFARCVRFCARIPFGFVRDESEPVRAYLVPEGGSAVGDYEWFSDTSTACVRFKNWSGDQEKIGTIMVILRPR
jgi:hypothetical protein